MDVIENVVFNCNLVISPVASKMFLIGNNLSFGNINTFFKDKATLLLG
jgi:hypothetical protein